MFLSLTNKENRDTIMTSPDEGGWIDALEANATTELSRPGTSIILIGDKPSAVDNIIAGMKVIGVFARDLLNTIIGTRSEGGFPMPLRVTVFIVNRGPNPVRVVLGDGDAEHTIPPGDHFPAQSFAYLELRELGRVQGSGDPALQDDHAVA